MRKTAPVAAVALVAAAALAACGGDAESSEDGEGGAKSYDSVQELVDAFGCDDFSAESEEMYVKEGGICEFGQQDVYVYTFANAEAQASYVDTASTFGGLYLVGNDWVVSSTRYVLEQVQEYVGGEIA
jgi:hypothetical protein